MTDGARNTIPKGNNSARLFTGFEPLVAQLWVNYQSSQKGINSMNTQIQFSTFNFKDLPVRVISDPRGEFWFCGTDVCAILGYTNSRKALQDHCKQGGVTKRYTPTKSADQEMTFINEPNLYRLIIKSRKPEAEPFEAWVFEEVLPQIRKTGKYQLQPQQLSLPEPEKKYTFEFTEYELEQLVWLWCGHKQMNTLLGDMIKPLETIGSYFTGMVISHHQEYQRQYKNTLPTIQRLIQPFKASNRMNWERAKNLIAQ
ncbi:putative phage-encoded protein [Haemophilus influenzae]|uniref:Putative phage-encoded protein n=2 Tax=Haemophilus influenzae TaxID=727 RepID=A0A158SXM5_HAEIF|nr:putative phage-encoded protein [Haemophilus influenzae]